jgi:diguanylate cyclase (GGDEF)-like protein
MMRFASKLFPARPPLGNEVRARLAAAMLTAALVVTGAELQRHWGSDSTGLYVVVVALVGITGLGTLWRQRWVVDNVGWLIDVIIFAQLGGGLALTVSGDTQAGGELLREMLFWAPLICAWWAVFYCGQPWRMLLLAAMLYAGLFAGGTLTAPGRFAHEYLIQGALAVGLVTMAIGLLTNSPATYRTTAAAFDAATHDPLTGIASRSCFEAEMAHIAAIADRQQQPFSLIMAIIGGVDARSGDPTLRTIAWLISDTVRHSDTVCRWQDSTFVVLLPGTRSDSARMVADKIQAALAGTRSTRGEGITVRIGLCEHRLGEDPLSTFGAVERAVV